MGVVFGYGRVSTKDQNEERQRTAIKNYKPDIKPENIFIDKISGKTFDRPQYNAMKQLIINIKSAYDDSEKPPFIEVVIEELDRLGRTKRGILNELQWFYDNHVIVRVLEIPTTLINIDASNDWVLDMTNRILIEVYTTLAEQEMEKREKRQAEGIAEAKKLGKYKGRKPIAVDPDTFSTVYQSWKNGAITAVKAMEMLNLKPNTFYRKVKEFEGNRGVTE